MTPVGVSPRPYEYLASSHRANWGADALREADLINRCAAAIWRQEGKATIPVDSVSVARSFGIDVVETPLRGAFGIASVTSRSRTIQLHSGNPAWVQRFVCAHELAHVLLQTGLLNVPIPSRIPLGQQKQFTEIVCDMFALALLVPEARLLAECRSQLGPRELVKFQSDYELALPFILERFWHLADRIALQACFAELLSYERLLFAGKASFRVLNSSRPDVFPPNTSTEVFFKSHHAVDSRSQETATAAQITAPTDARCRLLWIDQIHVLVVVG